MIDALAARARRVRGRVVRRRLCTGPGPRRAARDAEVRLVTALVAARAELAAVGAELAARGRWRGRRRVLPRASARPGRGRSTDLRALVRERRATYERELRRRHVPRVLLSDGTEPEALGATRRSPPTVR